MERKRPVPISILMSGMLLRDLRLLHRLYGRALVGYRLLEILDGNMMRVMFRKARLIRNHIPSLLKLLRLTLNIQGHKSTGIRTLLELRLFKEHLTLIRIGGDRDRLTKAHLML